MTAVSMQSSVRFTLPEVQTQKTQATEPTGTTISSLLPSPLSTKGGDFGNGLELMFKLMAVLQQADSDVQKQQIESSATTKTNLVHGQQQKLIDELNQHSGEGFFECMGNLLVDNLKDLLTLNVEGLVKDNIKDFQTMANSPQFAEDLKKVGAAVGEALAIVVGAAVTVCSFGSASPAAVALIAVSSVLCAAAFVEQNFHVLEAAGVDAKIAQWIGVGCAVGGAVAGLVGSSAGGATAAVEAIQAGCDVASGVGTALSAVHTYEADRAHIAATAARQAISRMQRIIENLIDDVKDSAKQASQVDTKITETIQTYFESRMIPLTGVRA